MPLYILLLLLLAGDVERNPGPPKKGGPPGGKAKEPTKEELMQNLHDKVKDYEEKVDSLEKEVGSQRKEIQELKQTISSLTGFEKEVQEIRSKMESISGVYDDLNEKMHDVDKSIKNNLLFYGLNPDFLPEIPPSLMPRIQDLFRFNLGITRDITMTKVARLSTGPEIRGSRPILVSFLNFKDREEILSKSKLLKSSNIYVSEDLSRKTREHRQELQKFLRKVKTKAPNRNCVIRYDKLYIDNQPYVFDEAEGRVVKLTQQMVEFRSDSGMRSESSLGRRITSLPRSESVHSVNGHPELSATKKISSFGSSEDISPRNNKIVDSTALEEIVEEERARDTDGVENEALTEANGDLEHGEP